MAHSAAQPIRSFPMAAGTLLLAGLLLIASLACLVQALVANPSLAQQVAPAAGSTLQHARHAAELWSGAPCTCDIEHAPAPTQAQPLMPMIALFGCAIVIAALWRRALDLPASPILLHAVAIMPATPPPQA